MIHNDMKDYDHVVVWTDYFNSALSRSQGRRMTRKVCVRNPIPANLAKAAQMAGFKVVEVNEDARHPKRDYKKSGYVCITKKAPKSRMLYRIAPKLVRVSKQVVK